MQERYIFREMLSEIKELADQKGNVLTLDEVKEFFKNAHLTDEQLNMVCVYLIGEKIRVEGYEGPEKQEQTPEKEEAGAMEESDCLELYQAELEEIKGLSEEEELKCFQLASAGDPAAKSRLTEHYLKTVYDLSKAQEKMGVIIINANVKDYKLYINGAVAESPAVLPMGEYDLVILKNGYTEWSQHVTLDKDTLNVTAELQKDVQYGTLTVTADVDGAWVYINGEEYGVAPMQVNLPYGSYNVMLEKSGYQSYKQSIQISSQTAAIHATME